MAKFGSVERNAYRSAMNNFADDIPLTTISTNPIKSFQKNAFQTKYDQRHKSEWQSIFEYFG